MNKMKPNTYLSYSEAGISNGSFYRVTGRKKEFAAHYILGDFVRFVSQAEMLEGLDFQRSKKEALWILPGCFK